MLFKHVSSSAPCHHPSPESLMFLPLISSPPHFFFCSKNIFFKQLLKGTFVRNYFQQRKNLHSLLYLSGQHFKKNILISFFRTSVSEMSWGNLPKGSTLLRDKTDLILDKSLKLGISTICISWLSLDPRLVNQVKGWSTRGLIWSNNEDLAFTHCHQKEMIIEIMIFENASKEEKVYRNSTWRMCRGCAEV